MQETQEEKQQETNIIDEALALLREKLTKEKVFFSSAPVAKKFAYLKLAQMEHEVFGIIHLDSQHRMIDYEEIFRGTIDGASVYPREVAKSCLSKNTAACIMVHNHPSGKETPSESDKKITSRLKEALGLFEIRVLDHLVVGDQEVFSFAERGYL